MTKKSTYKATYPERMINIALGCKKMTNKIAADAFGVGETTIRDWRKQYPKFEKAFTSAHGIVIEEINKAMRGHLKTRHKKIIKQVPGSKDQVIIEQVLPTHNDLSIYCKLGGVGTVSGEAHEQAQEEAERRKRDNKSRKLMREIMERKIAGNIKPLEAVQLLEAEGITAPASLMLEVERALGVKDDDKDKTPELTPEQRKARIAELEEKHRGRIKPADNAG